MRIGISLIDSTIGGPRTYAVNLIRNLIELDGTNEYFVFTDRKEPLKGMESAEWVWIPLVSKYLRPLWDNVQLVHCLKKYSVDLFHDTRNVLPVKSPCANIVTLHDMAPFIYPETFGWVRRLDHHFNMKNAAGKAMKIITDSEFSRQDIVNVLDVPDENVVAVYLGVSDNFKVIKDISALNEFRKKYSLPEKFILTVGTSQTRKNIPSIIDGFNMVKNTTGNSYSLVMAGTKKLLGNSDNNVCYLRSISDDELPLLYNCADIYISASSYEGFGLSILEAMACGVPVIAGRNSSVPEVVGDSAMFIDNPGAPGVAQALNKLLSDKPGQTALSERSVYRSEKFSWRKTAKETLDVYKKVLN